MRYSCKDCDDHFSCLYAAALTFVITEWPGCWFTTDVEPLMPVEREREKYYTFPALRLIQVLPGHALADSTEHGGAIIAAHVQQDT